MSNPPKRAMILRSDFKQEPTMNHMLLFPSNIFCIGHIKYGLVTGNWQNTNPRSLPDPPGDTAAPEGCDKSSLWLPVSNLPSHDGPGLGRSAQGPWESPWCLEEGTQAWIWHLWEDTLTRGIRKASAATSVNPGQACR